MQNAVALVTAETFAGSVRGVLFTVALKVVEVICSRQPLPVPVGSFASTLKE